MSEPKFKPGDKYTDQQVGGHPGVVLSEGHKAVGGGFVYLLRGSDEMIYAGNDCNMHPVAHITFTEAQIEVVMEKFKYIAFTSTLEIIAAQLRREYSVKNQPPTEGTGEAL